MMRDNAWKSLTLILPVAVALGGWVVVHKFTSAREYKSQQREYRVEFLIEAYRNLERAAQRNPIPPSCAKSIEEALGDIQLLGSPQVIEGARQVAMNLKTGSADIMPLLKNLRSELRTELGLQPLDENPLLVRMDSVTSAPCKQ